VTIRTFQPGDEVAQPKTYNARTSGLPEYNPAAPDDIRAAPTTSTRPPASSPSKAIESSATRRFSLAAA
jgi:hypothetical protein